MFKFNVNDLLCQDTIVIDIYGDFNYQKERLNVNGTTVVIKLIHIDCHGHCYYIDREYAHQHDGDIFWTETEFLFLEG